MAYDEDLADRIRELLGDETEPAERKMFGGLAFLVGGNMAVAVTGQGGLMVRVDPTRSHTMIGETGVRLMEMRGRPLQGWLLVDAEQLRTTDHLAAWVEVGMAYARALPSKR